MTHDTFQISWLKRSIILDPLHRHNFRLKRNIFLDHVIELIPKISTRSLIYSKIHGNYAYAV